MEESVVKLSARNVLKGNVTGIERGTVNAVVRIDIGGQQQVSSTITLDALNDMALKEGDEVYAVIKASNVILATM